MTEINTTEPNRVKIGPLATDLPFMIRNIYAMLRPVGSTIRDPLGIESGSIGVLSLIWVNPGISQNGLAANLAMKKSAITKLVKQLEAVGLLERKRVPGDRRMNSIALTSSGHRMVADIRRLTVALNENLTNDIPGDEREVFFRVPERLHTSLTAHKTGFPPIDND